MSEQKSKRGVGDDPRQYLGACGEAVAAEYLEEQGWEIVDRNRTFKMGELDIVARREEQMGRERCESYAFVEVKTRRSSTYMRAGSNITPQKRSRLVQLVKLYLAVEELRRVLVRIDVIEVDMSGEEPLVHHFPRAIDADGRLR